MSKYIFMQIIELMKCKHCSIYSLINTIKGASLYHMKEDFLFSLFFVRERHKARGGLRADQHNFNLKVRKLSISK